MIRCLLVLTESDYVNANEFGRKCAKSKSVAIELFFKFSRSLSSREVLKNWERNPKIASSNSYIKFCWPL